MITAIEYADEAYFNKTCGDNTADPGAWHEKVFNLMDIEDAYEHGRQCPNENAINRVFELNKAFLIDCKHRGVLPTNKLRNEFIYDYWDDYCNYED